MAEVQQEAGQADTGRRKRSVSSTFVFLKDWSGLLAFLIFLFTTLPFDLMDKYLGPTERKVERARAALQNMVDMNIEKAKALSMGDKSQSFIIANLYSNKIGQFYMTSKSDMLAAVDYLDVLEVIWIADVLNVAGAADDAKIFYEAAVNKVGENDARAASAYNGLGLLALNQDPFGGMVKAREYRIKYMNSLSGDKTVLGKARLATAVLDVGLSEMQRGDWPCGKQLLTDAATYLRAYDPYNITNMTTVTNYEYQGATITAREPIPGFVCPTVTFE